MYAFLQNELRRIHRAFGLLFYQQDNNQNKDACRCGQEKQYTVQ